MKQVFLTMGLTVALGLAVNGCTTTAATGELELSAAGSTRDHRKIATYYRHEAAKLRQASEDLSVRIAVYERLFGPTSDWVAGTRLLAQSYEEAAQEYERKAHEQMERIHESPRPTGVGLESR
ncbi:MAG: hypothetical protein KF876_01780 [Nitrospira sp.]|nr:hypothetical protein [Nitrospira sp.]